MFQRGPSPEPLPRATSADLLPPGPREVRLRTAPPSFAAEAVVGCGEVVHPPLQLLVLCRATLQVANSTKVFVAVRTRSGERDFERSLQLFRLQSPAPGFLQLLFFGIPGRFRGRERSLEACDARCQIGEEPVSPAELQFQLRRPDLSARPRGPFDGKLPAGGRALALEFCDPPPVALPAEGLAPQLFRRGRELAAQQRRPRLLRLALLALRPELFRGVLDVSVQRGDPGGLPYGEFLRLLGRRFGRGQAPIPLALLVVPRRGGGRQGQLELGHPGRPRGEIRAPRVEHLLGGVLGLPVAPPLPLKIPGRDFHLLREYVNPGFLGRDLGSLGLGGGPHPLEFAPQDGLLGGDVPPEEARLGILLRRRARRRRRRWPAFVRGRVVVGREGGRHVEPVGDADVDDVDFLVQLLLQDFAPLGQNPVRLQPSRFRLRRRRRDHVDGRIRPLRPGSRRYLHFQHARHALSLVVEDVVNADFRQDRLNDEMRPFAPILLREHEQVVEQVHSTRLPDAVHYLEEGILADEIS
ncbi:MAG: LOW QUALITY PROTEIN: hypothetical protein BJ554DRAFT_7896, partial [Olpidium bornovanus]